jgi:hypothetical protein
MCDRNLLLVDVVRNDWRTFYSPSEIYKFYLSIRSWKSTSNQFKNVTFFNFASIYSLIYILKSWHLLFL